MVGHVYETRDVPTRALFPEDVEPLRIPDELGREDR